MLLEISHFSLKRGLVALICISDLTEGVAPLTVEVQGEFLATKFASSKDGSADLRAAQVQFDVVSWLFPQP